MSKGFIIAGTHSGAGKTTVSLGLMGALARNYSVKPFKVGPDYIDTAYHKYITGADSTNLDLFMLGENSLKYLYAHNSKKYDISVVEGVMGLYDGMDNTSTGSTAHLAKILGLSVILVVDASAMAASVSAMVMGYMQYDPNVNIAGVILNKVGSEKHYHLLKDCIERDTGILVFGYLPKNMAFNLPSRHLGLVPAYEMGNLKAMFNKLIDNVNQHIDIDLLLNAAKEDDLEYEHIGIDPVVDGIRIGVAMDSAFNFYYSDSLELLKRLGAQLVYFSPMKDKKLPWDIKGLLLGGGFPEVFARELSMNKYMRDSIKNAIEDGLPVYAECGGLMYLCRTLTDLNGDTYEMAGVIDADSKMTKRLQRFGYVMATSLRDNVLSQKGTIIKGHEFHHSVTGIDEDNTCYVVEKPGKSEMWREGMIKDNCLATYVHTNFWGNVELAKNFLINCEKV